ncbi:FtsX-like permease family protein [Fulvivirga sp. M361]|uniref:ABC transporter permease n=1 Tax=Fulvivirga sp. M361 TaxID=2594266 RepID=UPI00117BD003|nr:ABC transporter permease [Fulvivirga sp. M361]TRX61765.1 FtsX-like permease family protein [Fulvivirga sp. M361]
MLKNYFVVTLRNIFKNSVYSFINITGLAIGIVCSLLIILWVEDEVSYDHFIPKSERLYQVWVNAQFSGEINSWNSVPLPTYEAMKTRNSNIVNSAVSDWGGEHLLKWEETRVTKTAYYVSEEFLEMFGFSLSSGSAETVLDDPYSIVLTASTAKALFNDDDPINKVVRFNDQYDLKVTGVLEDLPENSSFEFDFLVTWKLNALKEWIQNNNDNWGNYSFQVYVELNNPENELEVEQAIVHLLQENGEEDMKPEFFLHPMHRWRLHSTFENGQESGGRNDFIRLFTIIAIFILVIACINFMNLATARSERRAKEVGIRKSIGSNRYELILQFLGESLFIATVSFIVALLVAQLVLPAYNDLVDKQLSIPYASLSFWLFSIGIILFTGLVSGSYPAFYLSSFQPVKVLKGKVTTGRQVSTPRKVLVTLQFGFAILLIIGTIVIFRQIQLVKSRDLGYDQENLISIFTNDELDKNYYTLKDELEQSGAVLSVTRSNGAITTINSNNFVGWPGKPEDLRVIFTTVATEYDYARTMGIEVLMGRDFSREFKSDTAAIIINKAALDLMDLDEPIGTELDLWGGKRTLIGVVDNVLMGSPNEAIKPLFMIMNPDWINVISVRLKKTNDLNATLAQVEGIFEKHNPAYPFEYTFADEAFQKKFTTVEMTSKLATLFASLAIVITGLGLFGLASFTAEQRTKEIGIRKVLGASISSLVGLVSKEFSLLVIISFAISGPISWWLLDQYLDRYSIRTAIDWWVFPLTGGVALLFALIIVSNQAFRAAKANPAESLRSE